MQAAQTNCPYNLQHIAAAAGPTRPRPKAATASFRPPTASSGLVNRSCATCRGMRHWSSPVRQGEESVDTSADVSDRGAGFCGWRITATVWSQLDEICISFLELAFRDVRMQASLVYSPEHARQILEAVAEHRVSVASNPSYGLEETLELVWLAQDGKMKGRGLWLWVESRGEAVGVGDGLRCTVAPGSANPTPGKVVSKTMRRHNGMGRFFLVLVNRPFMDVIGKVIGEVGEEAATSTDVIDLDRITVAVTLWLCG